MKIPLKEIKVKALEIYADNQKVADGWDKGFMINKPTDILAMVEWIEKVCHIIKSSSTPGVHIVINDLIDLAKQID